VLIACGIAGGCLACFRPRRQETKTTLRVWLPCCTTVHPCRRCYPSRPSNLSQQRCNKNATWEAVCSRYMYHSSHVYAVWEHSRLLLRHRRIVHSCTCTRTHERRQHFPKGFHMLGMYMHCGIRACSFSTCTGKISVIFWASVPSPRNVIIMNLINSWRKCSPDDCPPAFRPGSFFQFHVLPQHNIVYRATFSKKGEAIIQDVVLVRHSHVYRCVHIMHTHTRCAPPFSQTLTQ